MIEALTLLHEPRAERREYDLRDLGALLQRRRREGLIVFFAVAAIGLLMTFLAPRTYTTTTKLIAGNPAGPSMEAKGDAASALPVLNALLTASSAQNAQTYAALFQQIPTAQDVVDDLHLNVSAAALLSHVTVTPETNTSLLDVAVSWRSPVTSARIANAFAGAVMDRQRQLIAAQADAALQFISGEMPKARSKMQHAASELAAFEAAHKLVDVSAQTQSFLAQYDALDAKIRETGLARRQAQAQLAAANDQLASVPAQIAGTRAYSQNAGTSVLQTQLSEVESRLRDALQRFTPKHPTVLALQSQARALRRQIASQTGEQLTGTTLIPNPLHQQLQQEVLAQRSIVDSSGAALTDLARQQKQFAPRLRSLPAETMKYADLRREAKSAEAVYNALQQKYDEATVASSTVISDVTVTQPASASLADVRPDTPICLLLALVAGLGAALGAILVIDLIDRRVKNAGEVERVLGLDVIVDIPRVAPDGSPQIRSLAQSAFLRLASAIRFSAAQPKIIAITSPARQEGKSTVALNLGLALAEFGARTLVVDAGYVRYPDAALGYARGSRGFFDALSDPAQALESAEATRSAFLHVLAAGRPAATMLQELTGPAAQTLFETLRERYEYVIVDAPALSSGIAANVLLQCADTTFMVLKNGVSDLTSARRLIEDARTIGVRSFAGAVLNGASVQPVRNSAVASSAIAVQ